MDRKHIDERHMVALYLADKLGAEERAAFETTSSSVPSSCRNWNGPHA